MMTSLEKLFIHLATGRCCPSSQIFVDFQTQVYTIYALPHRYISGQLPITSGHKVLTTATEMLIVL